MITADKPDIKLIDEDKTVTISLYTYNKLMYDRFQLESSKALYDVTRGKLEELYDFLMTSKNLFDSDKEKIKNIYYDIKDDD